MQSAKTEGLACLRVCVLACLRACVRAFDNCAGCDIAGFSAGVMVAGKLASCFSKASSPIDPSKLAKSLRDLNYFAIRPRPKSVHTKPDKTKTMCGEH